MTQYPLHPGETVPGHWKNAPKLSSHCRDVSGDKSPRPWPGGPSCLGLCYRKHRWTRGNHKPKSVFAE